MPSRELTAGGPEAQPPDRDEPDPETRVELTLFASERYVTRNEARDLHLGRRALDQPAHFLLPLRRALARVVPGAFDAPPRAPWTLAELRGGALRLGLSPRADARLPEVIEAAEALGLSLFDAAARETSQPMRLDRTDMLVAALADVASDGYVILEGGPGGNLYVQAFGEGPDRLRVEAVSSQHLPPELAPTPLAVRALLTMGFEPPDEAVPNFFRVLARNTLAERRFAAERMTRALFDAYSATPRETYRLRSAAPDGAP